MKKLLAVVVITGSLIACNNSSQKTSSSADSAAAADSAAKAMVPKPDNTMNTAAAVKDSVMQFKDGKVMIMSGGSWTALTATVTTTNGRKVSPNGEISKNGKSRKMDEGMMIDKDGQLMDKDGKMMDNTGWE